MTRYINLDKPFQITKTNTPLDSRSMVNTLSEVSSIQNPILGGIFYCVETAKHYKITSLANADIGGVDIDDARVGTFEEFGTFDFNGLTPEQIAELKGEPGIDGQDGQAATVTVGTVTTAAPGTPATVTNSGTASAAVLDFVIPQGTPGQDGQGSTVDLGPLNARISALEASAPYTPQTAHNELETRVTALENTPAAPGTGTLQEHNHDSRYIRYVTSETEMQNILYTADTEPLSWNINTAPLVLYMGSDGSYDFSAPYGIHQHRFFRLKKGTIYQLCRYAIDKPLNHYTPLIAHCELNPAIDGMIFEPDYQRANGTDFRYWKSTTTFPWGGGQLYLELRKNDGGHQRTNLIATQADPNAGIATPEIGCSATLYSNAQPWDEGVYYSYTSYEPDRNYPVDITFTNTETDTTVPTPWYYWLDLTKFILQESAPTSTRYVEIVTEAIPANESNVGRIFMYDGEETNDLHSYHTYKIIEIVGSTPETPPESSSSSWDFNNPPNIIYTGPNGETAELILQPDLVNGEHWWKSATIYDPAISNYDPNFYYKLYFYYLDERWRFEAVDELGTITDICRGDMRNPDANNPCECHFVHNIDMENTYSFVPGTSQPGTPSQSTQYTYLDITPGIANTNN